LRAGQARTTTSALESPRRWKRIQTTSYERDFFHKKIRRTEGRAKPSICGSRCGPLTVCSLRA